MMKLLTSYMTNLITLQLDAYGYVDQSLTCV